MATKKLQYDTDLPAGSSGVNAREHAYKVECLELQKKGALRHGAVIQLLNPAMPGEHRDWCVVAACPDTEFGITDGTVLVIRNSHDMDQYDAAASKKLAENLGRALAACAPVNPVFPNNAWWRRGAKGRDAPTSVEQRAWGNGLFLPLVFAETDLETGEVIPFKGAEKKVEEPPAETEKKVKAKAEAKKAAKGKGKKAKAAESKPTTAKKKAKKSTSAPKGKKKGKKKGKIRI